MIRIAQNINYPAVGQKSDNVNFTSKINLVDTRIFWKKYKDVPKPLTFIDYPWTPNEIRKGLNVWTEDVKTCTAGGIVTQNADGSRGVVMFHLDPDKAACMKLTDIKDAFKWQVGNAKPLQALIVGSKNDKKGRLDYSGTFFDLIDTIIYKIFNVPVTKLKGIAMGGYGVSALYEAQKDEWTILNEKRDIVSPCLPERKGAIGFEQIEVSPLDKLVYDEE